MLKPFTMICLAATAFAVGGAFLLAQGEKKPNEARPARTVLAMQESRPATHEGATRLTLANVGWIGVMLEDNKGHGVKVKSVFPAGPAAFAGVRAGDVLIRVGSTEVNSTQDAETAIEHLTPQQQSGLSVERGRHATELKVTAGSLAEFRRDYIREMMRRDPRDPKYTDHHGVSEADISAEVVRRLFEQHERMERSLNDLAKEVHALRKQVAALQK
jgi:predicted metalloprotease with PDZ domain